FDGVQPLEQRVLFSAQLDPGFGEAPGDANAIAFDRTNALHRVWRDTATGQLMHAVRQADLKSWSNPVVVDPRAIGGEISLAIDPTGRPAVAYSDAALQDLLVARYDGKAWQIAGVDKLGDVGDHPALAFSAAGKPYVTYHDATNDDLKLAWTNSSGKWVTHRLDSAGDVGAFSSIQLDPATGLIRVAYADNTNNSLKFANQAAGGKFAISTIDAGTLSGVRWISMAIDAPRNVIGISYYDVAARDLKFAEFRSDWVTRRVGTQGNQGEFSALHYRNGSPSVSWFNRSLGTVNSATLDKNAWITRLIGWSAGQVSAAVDRSGNTAVSMLSMDGKRVMTPGDTTQRSPTSNDPNDYLVEWKTIGGSTRVGANRQIGWNIKAEGWGGFVRKEITPVRSLGMKRLFLHNPFGTLPNQVMQFDQYLEAKASGLTWLTNGFVEAFRPLTDSGMEVIGYLGSLPHDAEFTRINKYEDYVDRVRQSIQPLVDAGMSIAFDYVVSAKYDDWAFQVVQSLRDSGVKVYAESRAPAAATFWHSHATIHVESIFQEFDPAQNATQAWAVRTENLRGEVLRWVGDPTDGSSRQVWQTKTARKILADGHSAMIGYNMLRNDGWTPQRLFDAARAQAAQNPPPPVPQPISGEVIIPEGTVRVGTKVLT
ncbi:MAG TPA: hypothetical protein PLD59_15585, partial [Tepidisphaeraceae bacterium]|nr:hypothetical protein [Tepidisphaeraceae bacterium]